MREHAEWNVLTHIRRATGPTSEATRSFISPAALLVNVMARRPNGETRFDAIRYATRRVSTRVLPEPAPATTRIGPSGALAASRCTGLSPSRSCSSRSGSTTSGGGASSTAAAASASASVYASGGAAVGSTMTRPSYVRPRTGPYTCSVTRRTRAAATRQHVARALRPVRRRDAARPVPRLSAAAGRGARVPRRVARLLGAVPLRRRAVGGPPPRAALLG